MNIQESPGRPRTVRGVKKEQPDGQSCAPLALWNSSSLSLTVAPESPSESEQGSSVSNCTCPPGGVDPECHGPSKLKDTNPKDAMGVAKVPLSTVSAPVMAEVGLAMMEGALKYGRHNYRVSGVRASVYYDAAIRHLMAFYEGQDIDPDSKLPHIVKVIACMAVLRDSQIQGNWVDDRPPKSPDGWLETLNARAKELLVMYPDPVPAHLETDRGS